MLALPHAARPPSVWLDSNVVSCTWYLRLRDARVGDSSFNTIVPKRQTGIVVKPLELTGGMVYHISLT